MEQDDVTLIQKLQARIDAALHEDVAAIAKSDFSDYIPNSSSGLTRRLMQAAQSGGLAGINAALDEFERLAEREDLPRLQHALMIFLTQHPAVAEFGLRVPSLAERSPSQILPSKRDY